jgi:CBS domain-containing protein
MRVSEAMHRNATWVPPTMPVPEIAKIMKEQDIGAVPVGENDRLIGMATDRDIAIGAAPNASRRTGR